MKTQPKQGLGPDRLVRWQFAVMRMMDAAARRGRLKRIAARKSKAA